jgi:uncharacterized protein YyaL (SSP411 family)
VVAKVDEILGDDANLFKDHYYVKSSGNCDLSRMSDPHDEFKGKNVLFERRPISYMASKHGTSLDEYSSILGDCRKKLFEARSKRPRPHLDDKVSPLSIFVGLCARCCSNMQHASPVPCVFATYIGLCNECIQ